MPSANYRCGAEEQTADHILASCPMYHSLNGTLGWWLSIMKLWTGFKKLHSTSDDKIGANEEALFFNRGWDYS